MNDQQWDEFLLVFKGNVDESLAGYVTWADQQIAALTGTPLAAGEPFPAIADGVDLSTLTLTVLQSEMARLEALVSADKVIRDQYTALSQRIAKENAAHQTLIDRHTDALGAAERKKTLQRA